LSVKQSHRETSFWEVARGWLAKAEATYPQLVKQCAVKGAGLQRVQLQPGNSAWLSVQDGEGGTSSESEARPRLRLGNKPRSAATAETMGYERAFHRAVDSPQ